MHARCQHGRLVPIDGIEPGIDESDCRENHTLRMWGVATYL